MTGNEPNAEGVLAHHVCVAGKKMVGEYASSLPSSFYSFQEHTFYQSL
jgi:hypothetical protein